MKVEFCEDKSGSSTKMRYFRKHKGVPGTPGSPLDPPQMKTCLLPSNLFSTLCLPDLRPAGTILNNISSFFSYNYYMHKCHFFRWSSMIKMVITTLTMTVNT